MRVIAVFFILASIVSLSFANENYVIGGTNARLGQFPFKVSLRTFGHRHFCGGVIVNARWFMTAAHCVYNRVHAPRTFAVVGRPVGRQAGRITTVTQIIVHPKFEKRMRAYDIAMMRAVVPLRFDTMLQPVRLPNVDVRDDSRTPLYVVGLGVTRVSFCHNSNLKCKYRC